MRRPLALAVVCLLIPACSTSRPRPPAETTPGTFAIDDHVQVMRVSRSAGFDPPRTTTTSVVEIPPPMLHPAARSGPSFVVAKPEHPPIRPREAPRAPPAPRKPAAATSDGCGGWRDLVATFWPPSEVGNACRRLMCESGGRSGARNGRYIGLMQVGGGSTDPAANLAQAFAMWSKRGWAPWTCR